MTLTRHKSVQSFRRYTKAADQQAAEAAFYETKRRKRKTEPPLKSSGTALRHRKADGIKICGKSAGAKWKIGFD